MSSFTIELDALQERLGYSFSSPDLLVQSLTHPSYSQNHPDIPDHLHNQRLEFLGDAILSAMLAEVLYYELPREREGVLTRNRSALAKGCKLAEIARQLELGRAVRLDEAEERNGGRERDSILEDAFEAVVGAVYLDAGWETARRVILGWFGDIKDSLQSSISTLNPKGRLQELIQSESGNNAIEYVLADERGPDHNKQFRVIVLINGKKMGSGEGSSKKSAEEQAAEEAYKNLTGQR